MIVTKTPLRVSFFGGGSDLPEFYNDSPGAVLSTTIDVSMFIAINESPKKRIKACYDEIEIVDTAAYLNHNRIRETLLHHNITNNLEISSFCNIPTKGTGLGSSSSYTVGLSHALSEYEKVKPTKYELAETAYFIERERCNEKLGKQDQYAAAFGGINLIQFFSNDVQVTPVNISSDTINKLNTHLMFFYTGITRVANDILEHQASKSKEDKDTKGFIKRMVDVAFDGSKVFTKSGNIKEIGSMLDYTWALKRQLTRGISNEIIDTYYADAMRAGAVGGKLLGAGGGGFLMFVVPPNKQQAVREAIPLTEYKFNISLNGSEVVLNDR
jgi:D-glycero-alpha-D-manno-heptose-7-phosphate kinase